VRDEVEKTEPPTPHKIEEARERGFVPKSREIVGLAILLAFFIFLWFVGKKIIDGFSEGMNIMGASELSGGVISFALDIIWKIAIPIFIVAIVAAIIGNVIQTGFFFAPKAFEPKIEKFSPAQNFSRIFSLRNFVEFVKSAGKAFVVLGVVFLFLYISYSKIDEFFGIDISDSISKSASLTAKIVGIIIGFLALLSIADYIWQRWDWWKSLMMSRSELREEMRRYEGDPTVKGRMRRRMFEMARMRMMAEVPRADVVITNPTHIAVAIKYERGKMKAPRVVAKGMNFIAQKIVEIAKENNVPIYQDPPLAWTLYKSVNVGDYIPESLYKAVAKVLAYVIMLKQKQKTQ
jgi:flagellar biosynthesis protein FlhB